MPQILFLLLIGAGVWAGYRWYQRETKRVSSTLKRAEEELRRRDAHGEDKIPELHQDPETGIYRPAPDDGERRS